MEARISVDGSNADRVALWDWLFDDPDLRDLLGRDASIEVNSLTEYVVSVDGPGAAIWAALAHSLAIWLGRCRAALVIAGPYGATAVVTAGQEVALRRVLGVREFSTPA
ncbi:effector-associated constant component EACC1 [Paractinoplanes durhamensis]|uniref:Uncharacterized protein n=1 Tax=Paractinoplanes durhamensis TaxID=113563 RepID=A0ABQ3YVU9_9ACTN|nr:hypothetical protein [Actinoplanes durhamensis]GIE01725.1 hypothetical protein Adu01nite_30750 [Actinoplanes durhamensis]